MSTFIISEQPIEKKYFTISEVACEMKVSPSLIRFWLEKLDISIRRTANGRNRMFTDEDKKLLREIHFMVKVEKIRLEGVKLKLDGHV